MFLRKAIMVHTTHLKDLCKWSPGYHLHLMLVSIIPNLKLCFSRYNRLDYIYLNAGIMPNPQLDFKAFFKGLFSRWGVCRHRGELIWRLSCYLKCVLTFNCLYHNIPDTLQRSMPFFLWLIYVCVAAMLSICLQQLRAFLPKKTTLPPMDYRRFLPPIYLDISFWWEIWFQQINISKQHLIKSRCGYFQTICF